MATISSLDIQISAQMTNASASISLLNKKLNTLASSLSYINNKSLNKVANFTKTAENLSKYLSALSKIDSGELSNFAKGLQESSIAMSDFAQASLKLNEAIKSLDFNKAVSGAKQFDSLLKEQSNAIAQTFGITGQESLNTFNKAMKELSQSTVAFAKGSSDKNLNDSYVKVLDTVKSSAKIFDEAKRSYASLIEYIRQTNISGQKVYLPFNPSEFGDDYKSMRSTLGKAFTSDVSAKNSQDIDSYVRELNSVLGETVKVENNAADTFRNLVEAVRQGKDAYMSYDEAVRSGAIDGEMLNSAILKTIDSIYELQVKMNEVGTKDTPLSKFAQGMAELGEIKAPSMQWITTLSNGLEKLKGLEAGNLSAIAKALKEFNGISSGSLSKAASQIERMASIKNEKIENLIGLLGTLPQNLSFDATNFSALVNGISKLGGKKAISGAENLSNLKNNLTWLINSLNEMKGLTFDTSSLTGLLDAITRLGNSKSSQAAKNLSPISAQLQNLIRQLNGIKTLSFDTSNLTILVNSISKLGGKSVERAIENIPKLGIALDNLMTTLSRSPAVSQNVLNLINSLSKLATQGGKIGTSSKSVVKGLNNTSNAMNKTKASTLSLATAFGKFYASYFWIIRGTKAFMKAITGVTDYIEAYNYYEVAFNKIAKEWTKDFDKYGEEAGAATAEEYGESFTKRMNETLGKLSGVQLNPNTQLLEETGMKNLGLNIQQVTQYASQLASVTNSIGQTGEVSLAASKSMTMLAGDISSLFNVDFQDVANNLQSGLIGQSRALYKYGIDITNATLSTYAYNLGLEKSVSEMTQAEKMQLRMLAILDQSKVSWGDLANKRKKVNLTYLSSVA
ncbi:MAG: hypothetical protein NC489_35330 [Ruminococcus flavefaciens]|nr:hypothetical protein [Ruminococcus flavefaciens]